MLGLIVSPDRGPDARILHTVFVSNKDDLLYIRAPEQPNFREISKEERKIIEKVGCKLFPDEQCFSNFMCRVCSVALDWGRIEETNQV